MFDELGVLDEELRAAGRGQGRAGGNRHEVPRRVPRSRRPPGPWSTRSSSAPPGPGPSWKSVVDRHIRSSATGSTSCWTARSSSSTGPGCPVCVTPLEMIDRALEIASRDDVIFCSFGDMLRVPGSHQDLFSVRARGGDVRIVYSPLDATRVAADNPDKQVVFFGVGFETTAPANAMAVVHAQRLGLTNFSMLVSHVLVPPAMTAILSLADQPGAGFPGRRPRLHRDGHRGVRAAGREVRGAHRGDRLRAAGPARGCAAGGRSAGGGQGRSCATPIRGRSAMRATPWPSRRSPTSSW